MDKERFMLGDYINKQTGREIVDRLISRQLGRQVGR